MRCTPEGIMVIVCAVFYSVVILLMAGLGHLPIPQ